MIELTPLDVRKKKEDFRRTVRGFDPEQVENFLELVAERLESLIRSETRLKDQTLMYQEQLETFQNRERALNDALVTAQELREEARSQSERAAELKLQEATRDADELIRGAEQAVKQSQERLDDLQVRRSQFLQAFRSMLLRFNDEVDFEEQRLTGPIEIDGEDRGAAIEPSTAASEEDDHTEPDVEADGGRPA